MLDISTTSQRRIFKTSAVMGSASMIAVLLGIVRMKVAAITIGPVGVGAVGLYQNTAALIIGVVGFGIGSAVPRELAAARDQGGIESEAEVRHAIFVLTLMLAVSAAALLIVFGGLVARKLFDPTTTTNVWWLAVSVGLGIISNSQTGLLTGLGRIGDAARANVMSAIFATVVSVTVLMLAPAHASSAIVLATYASTFFALSWFTLRNKTRLGVSSRRFPNRSIVRRLFALGITITSASLFPLATLFIIRRAILATGSAADLGYFQASWTIASLYLVVVLQAMAADFFPRLTTCVSNQKSFQALINDQTEVALLMGGPIILIMLGGAPILIKLLYGKAFYSALPVLRWQLVGDVLKIASWPFGFALLALNRRASYIIAEGLSSVVLLAVSVTLMRSKGITSFGIGYSAMYLCYLPTVFALTQSGMRVRWTRNVLSDFLILLLLASTLALFLPADPAVSLWFGLISGSAFALRSFLRLRHLLPERYAKSELVSVARKTFHRIATLAQPDEILLLRETIGARLPPINDQRPRVTFLVLAYNQESSVRNAVTSAFAQTYRPLEIILSDDGSQDRTFEIMQSLADGYAGPHEVRVRQSPHNRGIVGHIQDCVNESTGSFIIFGAGDDVSLPSRSSRLVQRWSESGFTRAVVYSDFQPMDRHGKLLDLEREKAFRGPFKLMTMARGVNTPFGATSAVTRDLITDLPPVSSRVCYEDRVFGFRALLSGGAILFVAEKLVHYQIYGGISRTHYKDRIEYVRGYARRHHLQRLADARQRLRDARLLRPDDRKLIFSCQSTVNDHRLRLLMSNGRHLSRKSVYFICKRARLAPLIRHWLNCEVARIRFTFIKA